MIGKRISDIADGSAMVSRSCGYMIWGIDDDIHDIVGTTFSPFDQKVKGQELVSWIGNMLSDNASFDFTEIEVDGRYVVILKIGASSGYPVSFCGHEYIRDGSYTKKSRGRGVLQPC